MPQLLLPAQAGRENRFTRFKPGRENRFTRFKPGFLHAAISSLHFVEILDRIWDLGSGVGTAHFLTARFHLNSSYTLASSPPALCCRRAKV